MKKTTTQKQPSVCGGHSYQTFKHTCMSVCLSVSLSVSMSVCLSVFLVCTVCSNVTTTGLHTVPSHKLSLEIILWRGDLEIPLTSDRLLEWSNKPIPPAELFAFLLVLSVINMSADFVIEGLVAEGWHS